VAGVHTPSAAAEPPRRRSVAPAPRPSAPVAGRGAGVCGGRARGVRSAPRRAIGPAACDRPRGVRSAPRRAVGPAACCRRRASGADGTCWCAADTTLGAIPSGVPGCAQWCRGRGECPADRGGQRMDPSYGPTDAGRDAREDPSNTYAGDGESQKGKGDRALPDPLFLSPGKVWSCRKPPRPGTRFRRLGPGWEAVSARRPLQLRDRFRPGGRSCLAATPARRPRQLKGRSRSQAGPTQRPLPLRPARVTGRPRSQGAPAPRPAPAHRRLPARGAPRSEAGPLTGGSRPRAGPAHRRLPAQGRSRLEAGPLGGRSRPGGHSAIEGRPARPLLPPEAPPGRQPPPEAGRPVTCAACMPPGGVSPSKTSDAERPAGTAVQPRTAYASSR
jgi:hypothetical protein